MRYPNAGELQRRTLTRLTSNPSEDEKVARAQKCSMHYHTELKRDPRRFRELELLGVQRFEAERPGDPDEYFEIRQCDRCPSSIMADEPTTERENPRVNASGLWEVSSSSGLEGVWVDEDLAQGHADELRRSGARDIAVRRRPNRAHPALARARGNPGHPSSVAYVREHRSNPSSTDPRDVREQFFTLLLDPDPAGMNIAQDLVIENGLSLITLSEEEAGSVPAHVVASGTFRLSRIHPHHELQTLVSWSVEPNGPVFHNGLVWRYRYGGPGVGITHALRPGTAFRTLDAARASAAADAWAVANALKEVAAGDPEIHELELVNELATVYASPGKGGWISVLPRELFGVTSSKKRTYAQAANDILDELERAGWTMSNRALKLRWAESPDRVVRLWFKPQTIHATLLRDGPHTQSAARAISYDLDIRKMSPVAFREAIERRYLGGSA